MTNTFTHYLFENGRTAFTMMLIFPKLKRLKKDLFLPECCHKYEPSNKKHTNSGFNGCLVTNNTGSYIAINNIQSPFGGI
jgi:hypothetical protein